MHRLLAHLAGDYLLQTNQLAQQKVGNSLPAAIHAASYTACFLPITRDWRRLAVIGGTHFVIDRWRLAKHVIWAKNQLAPADWRYSWEEGKANSGFDNLTPIWLSTWLMIIVDNTAHLALNELALTYRRR